MKQEEFLIKWTKKFGKVLRDFLLENKNPECTAKAIADYIGKHPSRIYQIADISGLIKKDHYNHLHAEMLPLLTKWSGDFRLLDFIEQSCGRVSFFIPPSSRHGISLKDSVKISQKILKEVSETVNLLMSAIEDGKVTNSEMRSINKESYEALQEIGLIWWLSQTEEKRIN